mmetsp:Transcript_15489/g.27179  ORF Transcript_15489/g.27179 Transcript_15489/m.27179 type:complete len:297 (-) Transcript_15489:708-1598(-)
MPVCEYPSVRILRQNQRPWTIDHYKSGMQKELAWILHKQSLFFDPHVVLGFHDSGQYIHREFHTLGCKHVAAVHINEHSRRRSKVLGNKGFPQAQIFGRRVSPHFFVVLYQSLDTASRSVHGHDRPSGYSRLISVPYILLGIFRRIYIQYIISNKCSRLIGRHSCLGPHGGPHGSPHGMVLIIQLLLLIRHIRSLNVMALAASESTERIILVIVSRKVRVAIVSQLAECGFVRGGRIRHGAAVHQLGVPFVLLLSHGRKIIRRAGVWGCVLVWIGVKVPTTSACIQTTVLRIVGIG